MCCVTCLCDPRVSLNSNMAACVEELLAKAQRDEEEKLKSITVTKELELTFDVGHLLACDSNRVEARALKEDKEQFLRSLARDNTQLLINEVWKLRAERLQEALVVKLPETHTPLPRAKPPPKVRAITKWEEFAKLKGIQKRKKTNLVWDENAKDWKRRWGYQRGGDDTKEWLIEVPVTAANTEDQFEKRSHAKKERVAKNEFNRLKNIARAQKIKVPGVGLTPVVSQGKDDLSRAVSVARTSTASAGRFQDRLPKEKAPKNQGKKRKFDAVIGNFSSEKQKQLDLLKLMDGKRPKLDVTKAVNKQMREEDQEEAQKYKKGKKGGRKGGGSFGGKGGGGGGSFGGKGKGGGGMGGKGKGKGGKPGKAKGKGGKGAVVGGKRRGKPGKR
ncbi:Rhodanese- sulfurtransferase [Dissostichus eleginoides]|nr:Rhodanese- sulfurtransferase [Dissostichus eleginoides]